MKFAVIGHPIDHSLSPIMHQTNFKSLYLNDQYEALNIPEQDFHHIKDIISERDLDGFNVTIPHKERIIPFLDSLTEEAQAIGAVNTVQIINNQWIGHNTDGLGFVKGLQSKYGDLSDAQILILGAGGASKGIAYALKKVCKLPITVANRTMARFDSWKFDVLKYTLNEVHPLLETFDIIINTTPVGMHQSTDSIITFQKLKPSVLVCDIIYNPLQTSFLKQAAQKGYRIYNGLDMFVFQGAESFKIWTGLESNISEMRQAVLKKLNETN